MARLPAPGSEHLGRIYFGKVVDNTSSDKKFVRVRIDGIDKDVPDGDLPWSGIGRPLFRGGGDNVGIWSIPRVGTRVGGIFDGGDRDSFVIFMEIENPANTVGWENDEWGVQDEEGTQIRVRVGETLHIEHKETTVDIDSDGNFKVKSPNGEATYEAGKHTFTGPVEFKDEVTMDKTLEVEVEATIGGIDFTPHTHPGVASGTSETGPPQ